MNKHIYFLKQQYLKFTFVNSYKKASLWNAVVGMHNLENMNESCHQVSVCVHLHLTPLLCGSFTLCHFNLCNSLVYFIQRALRWKKSSPTRTTIKRQTRMILPWWNWTTPCCLMSVWGLSPSQTVICSLRKPVLSPAGAPSERVRP